LYISAAFVDLGGSLNSRSLTLGVKNGWIRSGCSMNDRQEHYCLMQSKAGRLFEKTRRNGFSVVVVSFFSNMITFGAAEGHLKCVYLVPIWWEMKWIRLHLSNLRTYGVETSS
ncbi:unnamed protein product, partial [Linum tenue]